MGQFDTSTETTIEKLVQRVLDADETARRTAAGVLYQKATSIGLHSTDIHVRLNGSTGAFPLIEQLRAKINKQYQELDYLRQHVSHEILKAAMAAGRVEWRWPEFEELIRSRITGDPIGVPELTPVWKPKLVSLLGVSAGTIAKWQNGTVQIPEAAFDRIEELPEIANVPKVADDLAVKNKKERQEGRKRDGTFQWTPELYQEALELHRTKQPRDALYARCGITDPKKRGPLERAFSNDGPDEALLGYEIEIHDSGPMDHMELWKIGHSLWKADKAENDRTDTWRGLVWKLFNRAGRARFGYDTTWLTQTECDILREKYRDRPISATSKRQPAINTTMSSEKITPEEFEEIGSLCPGVVASVRRFIITHVQLEADELNKDTHRRKRINLRDRLKAEWKEREISKRYLHMSRGLALMEKRTEKQATSDPKSEIMTGEKIFEYGSAWFGERYHYGLGQLLGYDSRYIEEIRQGKRAATVSIERMILKIAHVVEGLDLDDEQTAQIIFKRVSEGY